MTCQRSLPQFNQRDDDVNGHWKDKQLTEDENDLSHPFGKMTMMVMSNVCNWPSWLRQVKVQHRMSIWSLRDEFVNQQVNEENGKGSVESNYYDTDEGFFACTTREWWWVNTRARACVCSPTRKRNEWMNEWMDVHCSFFFFSFSLWRENDQKRVGDRERERKANNDKSAEMTTDDQTIQKWSSL